jgi:hypothetical protein
MMAARRKTVTWLVVGIPGTYLVYCVCEENGYIEGLQFWVRVLVVCSWQIL